MTRDGGRTWQRVHQEAEFIYDVAVYGSSDAWMLKGPCAMGTCQIHVLFSSDGGRTWAQRSTTDLKKVSFVSANDGWGIGNVFPDGSQRIERTSDGGRTWQRSSVPCPHLAATATDLSFVSPGRGWLLCSGVAGAGNANRAILETTDGGRTWTTVAGAGLGGQSASGLTTSGYPDRLTFLADGHGWMSAERKVGIDVTTDGGRSWNSLGKVPNGASTAIGSLSFVSGSNGFALLSNGDERATQLIASHDGGRTWGGVASWPYESSSASPSRTVLAHGTDAGAAWARRLQR